MNTNCLPWFIRLRHSARNLAIILSLTLPIAATAQDTGTRFYVAKTGSDTPACGPRLQTACLTIQYAIDNVAKSGDVLLIQKGVYYEQVKIDKNVTLAGPQVQGAAIIDGKRMGNPLTNSATTRLDWITIRNGMVTASPDNASVSGGIVNQGTLTLNHVFIDGNSVIANFPDEQPMGAGILNAGTLNFNYSELEFNTATGGCLTAGAIANTGTLNLLESLIQLDQATGDASCPPNSLAIPTGIVNSFGTVQMNTTELKGDGITNNGTFDLNQSTVQNAAVNNYSKMTTLNSTFYEAPITLEGGGFNGIIDMSNTTLYDSSGPGLVSYAAPATSTIRYSLIEGNYDSNCTGIFISGGYNYNTSLNFCKFVGADTNYFASGQDLKPLGYNGGPTETAPPHLLDPSTYPGLLNPAGCFDSKGNRITVDQRGLPRPKPLSQAGLLYPAGNCDIGSVQLQPGER